VINRRDFIKTLSFGAVSVGVSALLKAGVPGKEDTQDISMKIDGVIKADVWLNGTWKFTLTPADEPEAKE
jgi:hypothetical protein